MPPIGEILVRKELISPRALAQVLKDQPNKRQRLISMLILRAELEIDDGATVLSEHTGYPAAYERHLERRDPAAVKLLPGPLCAQYAVICLGKTAGGRLIVGARDPSPELAQTIEAEAGVSISLAVVPALLIERLVKAAFGATISENTEFPATNANLPRAKSLSALYADATPPSGPTIDAKPTTRQPTPKVTIPAIVPVEDEPSAPILLEKPLVEKTQPRMAAIREPAKVVDEAAVTQQQRVIPEVEPIKTMPLTRSRPVEQPGPPAIASRGTATSSDPEGDRGGIDSVDMGALLGSLESEQGSSGEETVPERPFARPGSEPAVVSAGVPREPAATPREIRPPTQPPPAPRERPSQPAMPPRPPPQAMRPPTQPPMPPSMATRGAVSPEAASPHGDAGRSIRPSQPAMPPKAPPGLPSTPPGSTSLRPSEPAMLRTTLPGHAPGPGDDETTSVREETTAIRGPRRAPPPPSVDLDPPTVGPDALAERERPSAPTLPRAAVTPRQPPPPLRAPTDLPPPLGEVTPPPPADPADRRPAPADTKPPFASVALSDLAAEAGATASDPALALKPLPLSERPAQRTRSVSEMFDDISNEPPAMTPARIENTARSAPPPVVAEPPARPSAPPLPPVVAEPTARSAAPPPPRMPTEPTVNAGPPKPPPAPGTGSVDAVCKEIERAISRATADRVLITFAGSRFKTALLVMIVDGQAKGARGQGPRLAAAASVVVPLDQPSIIASSVESRATTHDVPSSPTQDRLNELLVTKTPVGLPVIVDDSVVAVLIVGDPAEASASEADLEKVVAAFATAYKRLYKPKP